ncbi:DUF4082 domain-containing protein [Microbacterium sp. HJ5]
MTVAHSALPFRTRLVTFAALAAVVTALLLVAPPGPKAQAASPCGATINPITCENQKPGADPEEWDIDGAGDPSIQGFANDISVNAGQKIDFKVDTNASAYSIKIYRTGWYQGLGARYITTVPVSATLPQKQPQCVSDVSTDLYDCGTWRVSASWNVPADAVSGVYVALLERADSGGASHIIFIVRNDGSTSDVVFQTSDPTWHAYNTYGGASFYQGGSNGRALKLSYNRPFSTRGLEDGRDFYFSSEYATVRFLERNGYDITYIAGVDTDRRGADLKNHKTFLSVGHDEYWSGAQRANIEAARDAGVNLQFLTGNEGYWRTRYEASIDGSQTVYRTLVSYKETWANRKIDPSTEWTGTSRDPRFATQAQGGHNPENALTGTMYMVNHDDLPVTVSSEEGKLRLWRNTSLSSLGTGARAALAPHTVGYESNEDVDNGRRPAGLIHLSTTTGEVPQYLVDYGNTVVPGSTVHHITLYRAASGALVFSAASIQWGWGLDQTHDGSGAAADSRMQQAQVNLLADMGAQPGSLMAGLSAATKSTDTTAPTTTITSPSTGQSIPHGMSVTITGTAADVGGRVAGVEVSTDDGNTWHAATGTTAWSYTYLQQGSGTVTLKARAIDDSANFAMAGATRQVTVTGPFSAFGALTPLLASADDTQPVELGLRFTPEVDGFVAGVRFYKGAANTGQHAGALWDATGAKLAGVVFGTETVTGWQTAEFTTPVQVYAGQEYTVSYTAPRGGYSMQARFWPYTPKTSPITVSSAVGAAAAGVYGVAGVRPTSTWTESNYFVDLVFTRSDTSPLRVLTHAPAAGVSSVPLTTDVRATFTRAADPATVSLTVTAAGGQPVAGATTYDATAKTAIFTPSQSLAAKTAYTVGISAADMNGVALEPGAGWSFTTQDVDRPAGECPCSLFSESRVPTVVAANDGDSVTLGVKFTVSTSGTVTAVKFYKGPGNGGAHTGAIWSASGERLASATFSGESTQGWQTAQLDTPVTVQPGVTYVASYVAPQGHYAATAGAFSAAYSRGPLAVPASGAVFTYSGGFPSSPSTTDYAVDIVFALPTDVPSVESRTPAADAVGVAQSTTVSATFTETVQSGFSGSVTADGVDVAGTWTRDASQKTLTFTPGGAFTAGAHVVVTLTGVRSGSGTLAAPISWAFTVGGGAAAVSLFSTAAPVAVDSDASAVELGMAFTSADAGRIRAIRYYKPAGTTGAHVGSLWGPNGQRLAQVAFTAESASGWQRAVLSTPVAIVPGLVYTVSYYAPNGRYAYTAQGFAAPVANGPLTALSPDNGRYRYGTGGTMPTSSWNSSNYFVDVEFLSDVGPSVTIEAVSPDKDAVDVAVTADVRVTLTADPGSRSVAVTVVGADGAVAGESTYDAAARRITFDPVDRLASATTYSVSVTSDGATVDTWTLKTAPAIQTLFGTVSPQGADSDTDPIEVGTGFHVAEPGSVTAIRFYKPTGSTGTHRGTLWNAAGEALGQVEFTNETASGWQRAPLAVPVPVQPGTSYTVSYFAADGRYARTSGYFAQERTVGFITAPAGTNGRYLYTPTGGLPTLSWNATAYFVDAEVDFSGGETPPPPPALTSFAPAAGASGVDPVTAVISANVSNASTASIQVTSAGASVAGSSAFDRATGAVVFTPTVALQRGTTYAVAVTADGSPVAGGTWSFSTRAAVTITSTSPTAGQSNVNPVGATVSATLANAASATLALTTGGTAVPGTSSFAASTGVVTFTPSTPLTWGRTYSVTVTGDGAVVGAGWSFSTLPVATLSSTTPAAAASNVDPVTAKVTATLGGAVSAAITLRLGAAAVAGTSSFNSATRVVTFTPAATLDWSKTYTATVTGNGTAVANGTWSFTTMAKPDQVSLFTTGTPANANANALLAYQVGTRFRTSAPGVVTTIRYYKGTQNTGTHTGYLRSANGTVLAQVTFGNGTASGWQTAVLSSPVRLTVGTEYRVTLLNASGRYAVTNGALASSVTVGPLSTLANGGVAGFGSINPTATNANKYWVDVVFDPDN